MHPLVILAYVLAGIKALELILPVLDTFISSILAKFKPPTTPPAA